MVKPISFLFLILFSCSLGVIHSIDLKHETNELEVHAPADRVWDLYRQLGIAQLAAQKLTNVIKSIEVLIGTGDVGTILKYTFVPGNSTLMEMFTGIDDKNMVKNVQVLDGGCLASGCSVELAQFDIVPKSKASCTIKTDVSYAVKEGFPKPDIEFYADFAQVAKKFLENPSGLN